MKLLDFIATVPSLSETDCGNLISFFEENSEHHIRNDNEVQHFTELNVNSVSAELSYVLVHKLKEVLNTYTDIHSPTGDRFFPKKFAFEEFRIKRYNNDDCFKQHVDVGDAKSCKRFLAFLFYLNDDFEGGGTMFRTPEIKYVIPKTGNCLVFPPTWQYPHEGIKANGTKYIMSTYLHYVDPES
jgi:hypothetical protein